MIQWRFEVYTRRGYTDAHGEAVLDDIRELGIKNVRQVNSAKVYLIEADYDRNFAQRIARELLADPVCQEYNIGKSRTTSGSTIEIHLKSGVTDPEAESVTAALEDMGKRPQRDAGLL